MWKHLQSSWNKSLTKADPLSDNSTRGAPYTQMILSKNCLASVWAFRSGVAHAIMYLVHASVTVTKCLFPTVEVRKGPSVSHMRVSKGAGLGSRSVKGGLIVCGLGFVALQLGQVATYSVTSLTIPTQKNLHLMTDSILFTPMCAPKELSCCKDNKCSFNPWGTTNWAVTFDLPLPVEEKMWYNISSIRMQSSCLRIIILAWALLLGNLPYFRNQIIWLQWGSLCCSLIMFFEERSIMSRGLLLCPVRHFAA